MYYMLKIKYFDKDKNLLRKDLLIFSDIEELKSNLEDFKSLSDVKDYKVYTCSEIDLETGELL